MDRRLVPRIVVGRDRYQALSLLPVEQPVAGHNIQHSADQQRSERARDAPLDRTRLVVVRRSHPMEIQQRSLDLEHAVIHAFRDVVLPPCRIISPL